MPTSRYTINRRKLLAASGAGAIALTTRPAFAQPATPAATTDWRDTTWTGTWADSPQLPFDLTLAPYTGRTYRHIVRISLGGNQVRVRLNNAHTALPQIVEAASVAKANPDGSVAPDSILPLTFGGNPSIMLAPDAVVASDPVTLTTGDRSDLAVSLYIPGDVVVDPEGLLTTAVSEPGDFTGETRMPTETTAHSSALLFAIDVAGATADGAIVALGGSSTKGTGSTAGANRRWTDVLSERLFADASLRMGMVNAGISGNRTLRDGTGDYRYRSGISALARFDRDVLSHPSTTHLIMWMGGNDIVAPLFAEDPTAEAVTVDELASGLRILTDRAHAHGISVILGTIPPASGAFPEYDAVDAERESLNEWIRSESTFDGMIDFDAIIRDPGQPNRLLPAFDSGDHLHPNDAGYQAIGEAVELDLFR
jgi:lysophospholipase L1-like esterase